MANFIINQTASEIQQILNKAETPDTQPTPNSQNLVESGGVKTYVDTQVSAGASMTTNSFAPSALEDSTDGITATDTAIPTSKAVKDFVEDRKFATGWTVVTIPTANGGGLVRGRASGTALKDMFFIASHGSDSDDSATIQHYIGGLASSNLVLRQSVSRGDSPDATIYVPVAAGEDWYFWFSDDTLFQATLKYKELT